MTNDRRNDCRFHCSIAAAQCPGREPDDAFVVTVRGKSIGPEIDGADAKVVVEWLRRATASAHHPHWGDVRMYFVQTQYVEENL